MDKEYRLLRTRGHEVHQSIAYNGEIGHGAEIVERRRKPELKRERIARTLERVRMIHSTGRK